MATVALEDAKFQVRAMTPLELQRHEDFAWAMANYNELDRQYRGSYVVVWRKQVIEHGRNPDELFRRAETAERSRQEFVLIALPDPFLDMPH